MSEGDISAPQFSRRIGGYNPIAFQGFLRLIADLRDKGFAPGLYSPLESSRNWPLSGYDPEAVDRFLAELAVEAQSAGLCVLPGDPDGARRPRRLTAARRQYARDCEAEWQRVPDLPGTRLRSSDGRVTDGTGHVLLRRGDFTIVTAAGHVLRVENQRPRLGAQVFDPGTAEPVLWIRGCHLDRRAGAYMLFPGKRCLVFPVTGTRSRNAVMTAVTESGSTVLWFHRAGWGVCDVVVSPDIDLTTETLCVVSLAAGWLTRYFERQGA